MKRIPFEYAVLAISVGVTFAVAAPARAQTSAALIPNALKPAPRNSRAASIW